MHLPNDLIIAARQPLLTDPHTDIPAPCAMTLLLPLLAVPGESLAAPSAACVSFMITRSSALIAQCALH